MGIVFTGLLAGSLPHGYFDTWMRHDDWSSPLMMALISTPAYSGVLPGMMRIGMMFDHGNSVGAGFILFQLGVGLNLGLILWLINQFGGKRMLSWLVLIVGVNLGIAYALEGPLYFAHEEASHTHAFDDWSSPFHADQPVYWPAVRDKLLEKIEILEPVALGGLALLMLAGGLLQMVDGRRRLEAYFAKRAPASDRPVPIWNRNVPGPILGVMALLGLVAFSIMALYIYYPDPEESAPEVRKVRADALGALLSGKKEEAIRQIEQWDLLTRKLQVGVFIRTGRMDPEVSAASEDLRAELEEARDALRADRLAEAKEMLPHIEKAYRRCRASYQTSPSQE
jgi:hypothetical protein